jgi:N-methylhydantoinase B
MNRDVTRDMSSHLPEEVVGSEWDGLVQSYRPANGWRARVSNDVTFYEDTGVEVDPITHEVIRHRLWTINMAHGDTITRISGSPIMQSLDFCMSIITADGETVVTAPYIQVITMGSPLLTRYILENFSSTPGINDGDIYLSNDPWIGSNHQMDVTLALPVFIDGKLFAWVANAGHQYDLGGIVPGGWPQNAPDAFSDPTCFPPFKIVERGLLRQDLRAMYLRQSRKPDLVALDLGAQLAGVAFARDQIIELCHRYQPEIVLSAMRRIVGDSRDLFRRKLTQVPDGKWSQVRYLDEAIPGDRKVLRTQLNVEKVGDRLVVDNVGTDPQVVGSVGMPFTAWSGTVLGTISVTMLYESLFAVGGANRQIDYRPQSGLITCANFPAEVSGGAALGASTGIDATTSIVAQMLTTVPSLRADVFAGSPETLLPILTGVTDEGDYFGQALPEGFAAAGAGASPFHDGVDTRGRCTTALTTILNVEELEQSFPIVYLYRKEDQDGGGVGRWRGGVTLKAAVTPYRANDFKIVTNTGGQGTSTHAADGLFGGYPSPAGHYRVRRGTNLLGLFAAGVVPRNLEDLNADESFDLGGKSNGTALSVGDVFEIRAPGGGGYGDPLLREPERVCRDVVLGYVSAAAAAEAYGVVLRSDNQIDHAATRQRRAEIMADRATWMPVTDIAMEPPTKAAGDVALPVHEYIQAEDRDGVRVLACTRCGESLGGYCDNPKLRMKMLESPVTVIPTNPDPTQWLDDDMVLRRYCCPGCLVLMYTQVVRSDECHLADMKLTSPGSQAYGSETD